MSHDRLFTFEHPVSLKKFRQDILVAICALLLAGCGSTQNLNSVWSDATVDVAGSTNGWSTGLTPVKDTPIALGIRNDKDFLYICLTSSNERFQRQFVSLGFTVWFQTNEGRMGLHYPVGFMKEGVHRPNQTGVEGEIEEHQGIPPEALRDLEVLGPGKNDVTMYSTLQIPGSVVNVVQSKGQLIYKMKVPLRQPGALRFALGADPGSEVSMEMEAGKLDASKVGRGERGGADNDASSAGSAGGGLRGGGMSRGGGRRGGGGGGNSEGMPWTPASPIDVKSTIHLAAASTP